MPESVGAPTGALPYIPPFVFFEDPEYNRRLASESAQNQSPVTVPDFPGPGQSPVNVTLATDRDEYNTTGAIHYLFLFDPPRETIPKTGVPAGQPITATMTFTPIDTSGSPTDLLTVPVTVNSLPDPAFQDIAMLNAAAAQKNLSPLKAGDFIMLFNPGQTGVQTTVSIVSEPVIPVPAAGYALLGKNPDNSVECVRFAFSPPTSRIDLVDPADLKKPMVRRRAVFQWQDTVRIGRTCLYAVQKVTTGGSTHFPTL
jgi:hypothetical protein